MPRPPPWLTMPNPETSWFELVERCLGALNLNGNAFVLITARDSQGFPTELWTLDESDVVVKRSGGNIVFKVGGREPPLTHFTPSNPAGDVLHIKAFSNGGLRGLSTIEQGRQAIGLGLVTEKQGAKFFGTGQQMSGAIQLPPAAPGVTQASVDAMRESWLKRHGGSDNAYLPGILTGGATWTPTSVSNEDAQYLETRKFQVVDIARLFRVPPVLIGSMEVQSSWGTGVGTASARVAPFRMLRGSCGWRAP